jgi:hypothetical protein
MESSSRVQIFRSWVYTWVDFREGSKGGTYLPAAATAISQKPYIPAEPMSTGKKGCGKQLT